MNDEALDGVLGQIRALSVTLNAVIASLPPEQAGAAAGQLQISLELDREQEAADGECGNQQTSTRDAIADMYVQLLQARALHGR